MRKKVPKIVNKKIYIIVVAIQFIVTPLAPVPVNW
jgi:hypothetical protein